jgi:hypothetical protein
MRADNRKLFQRLSRGFPGGAVASKKVEPSAGAPAPPRRSEFAPRTQIDGGHHRGVCFFDVAGGYLGLYRPSMRNSQNYCLTPVNKSNFGAGGWPLCRQTISGLQEGRSVPPRPQIGSKNTKMNTKEDAVCSRSLSRRNRPSGGVGSTFANALPTGNP